MSGHGDQVDLELLRTRDDRVRYVSGQRYCREDDVVVGGPGETSIASAIARAELGLVTHS